MPNARQCWVVSFSRGLFSEDTKNERGGDLIQETETGFWQGHWFFFLKVVSYNVWMINLFAFFLALYPVIEICFKASSNLLNIKQLCSGMVVDSYIMNAFIRSCIGEQILLKGSEERI